MKWIGIAGLMVALAAVAGCEPSSPPAETNVTFANAPDANTPEATSPEAAPAETAETKETAGTKDKAAATGGPARVPESKYKTLPSGLKYATLKEGTGKVAEGHVPVTVHYTGWLKSTGEKFDSSRDRGEPFTFNLGHGEVIPGWDQGVSGMKVGEVRQLVVPPDLGYGASGTPGGPIPPNATLVFDVELLNVGEGHAH